MSSNHTDPDSEWLEGIRYAGVGFPLPENAPPPLIIYLDHWGWSHIASDYNGTPQQSEEAGIFDTFRRSVETGKATFVLSQTHYRENWRRNNLAALRDMTTVMAILSGFQTISPDRLAEWEWVSALAKIAQIDPPTSPNTIGWGAANCIPGFIHPKGYGKPGDPTHHNFIEEIKIMAYGPEQNHMPYLDLLNQQSIQLTERAFHEELRIQALLQKHNASKMQTRDWINNVIFDASIIYIKKASLSLGLDYIEVLEGLLNRGPDIGDHLNDLISRLPLTSIYAGLRVAAHTKTNFNFKKSDVMDFFAASTVVHFADIFLCDAKTYNLLHDFDHTKHRHALVTKTLSDIKQRLEAFS